MMQLLVEDIKSTETLDQTQTVWPLTVYDEPISKVGKVLESCWPHSALHDILELPTTSLTEFKFAKAMLKMML